MWTWCSSQKGSCYRSGIVNSQHKWIAAEVATVKTGKDISLIEDSMTGDGRNICRDRNCFFSFEGNAEACSRIVEVKGNRKANSML